MSNDDAADATQPAVVQDATHSNNVVPSIDPPMDPAPVEPIVQSLPITLLPIQPESDPPRVTKPDPPPVVKASIPSNKRPFHL